jgi:hypothetical protein
MTESTAFPLSVSNLEGVQYVRISGAAGHPLTVTNLDQLTVGEVVKALVTLCNYCTELEYEVDDLKRRVAFHHAL